MTLPKGGTSLYSDPEHLWLPFPPHPSQRLLSTLVLPVFLIVLFSLFQIKDEINPAFE